MPEIHKIGNDELLYRKISVKSEWYDPVRNEIKPDAFKPWPRDADGISFSRERSKKHPDFLGIEEFARGPSVKGYFVAVFRAGDLLSNEFELIPDPDHENNNPGHSLMTSLRYTTPKDPECENNMARLAFGDLCLRVEGPFPP